MSTASTPRQPVLELLARYRAIWAAAWAAREELAGPKRLADEAAFLPAALSLQDTPAHPAPRRVAVVICVLFIVALLWSILGHVDIVAVANGRVMVSDRSKTIQPLEASVVQQVLVADGDEVTAGQVLVELDATTADADANSFEEQWHAAVAEQLRAASLLRALGTDLAPSLEVDPALGDEWAPGEARRTQAQAQFQAEWLDVKARLARLDAELMRRRAEIETVRAGVAKLEQTLPIAQQREADIRRLTDQGFMSAHAVQDRSRERIELERDLATQRAQLAAVQAGLRETEQGRLAFLAETRHALTEKQAQAALRRDQLTQERSKAAQRGRLTRLKAPVAGRVQQLAVHTAGGVVTPAQVLMVIVPIDAEVSAEVVVDNKDIGFIHAGQVAEVKLETFPFTRYGTIPARVETVSADAVADEQRGAIFPAVLKLGREAIDVDGKRIRLSPGMNVTAEIKTGRRRVIDYLLSPVEKAVSESLGER